MPKIAKPLTAIEISRITDPGQHPVGTVAGLRLAVKETGARSWVLRTMVGARRTDIGLGGYPTTTLKQAHERARAMLDTIRAGVDPTTEKRVKRATIEWTFEKAARAFIGTHRAGWKNAKHADQWESTLKTYVFPKFGDKHVRDVNKGDVLSAVEPIWNIKHETATRVRNRIELVLAYAIAHGYRPEGPNPARLKGNLDAALPASKKVSKVEHFGAMPIDAMHEFMTRLRAAEGQGARALEFAILTASRTGPVRAAEWSEIDLDARLWTIPAEKMKADRAHRVPLSPAAIRLLEATPKIENCSFVFPGTKKQPLSDMTVSAVMRRMKLDAVPHGFRSTFSDWCAERTDTPAEVREMALAHKVADEVEAAYRRGDLFEKRRAVMDGWARFIETPPPKPKPREAGAA